MPAFRAIGIRGSSAWGDVHDEGLPEMKPFLHLALSMRQEAGCR